MKKLKVCVFGLGKIFKKHQQAIKDCKKYFQLESVCEINLKKFKNYELNKKVSRYLSIDDACKNSKADIAVILTPSGYHYEHTRKISKFFKSIIVEKPMAMNFHEAKKIIKNFKRLKKNLFIVKQNRFNPPIIELKKAIDQKRFGKIFLATIRLRWNRDTKYFMQDMWRGTWKYDGGVLANQASHHIDLLQWLVGDLKSVYAKTLKIVKTTKVPDTCLALIKFKNGAIGSIEATTATSPKNIEGSISILGTKGTVVVGGFATSKIETWEFQNKKKIDYVLKNSSLQKQNIIKSNHISFYENVYKFLQNKRNSVTTYIDGAKSIKIIDKLYCSAEISREVFLDDKNYSKKLGH